LERNTVTVARLQDVDQEIFARLKANDILFIDSSHVAKIGSDVNHLMSEILPILAPGVHIHFHDIFYPFEYPRQWVEEGRAWNEAYLLEAFLSFNSEFERSCYSVTILSACDALVHGAHAPLPEEPGRKHLVASKARRLTSWSSIPGRARVNSS
jgi:hypothetical protein